VQYFSHKFKKEGYNEEEVKAFAIEEIELIYEISDEAKNLSQKEKEAEMFFKKYPEL
jgi:hypothetical protein